ncbi:DUF1775 domain-containing protein [Methylobacterium haplocladii]|uniref:YncI copper-binding domain-containing protein n=1 Tax=Methylobacterium haplocladii TaxID=1176176 RepID=A0A512IU15_9HYPH|nr:DUF1775 domain-containing protein [Methylobacterium haplocladii]GEP01129.1 hypothetical protein MHA02_35160 [Methylobacterium haplocladii]GJD82911.1 hypothetical protein HPGCJGGD_0773 [Methylobacterium haplocladii]GLS60446.1 hypothetical protein GCM10007887_31250 [Methylobacterium haplocladii]
MSNRYLRAALLAALPLGLTTSAALGHAVLERKEATPNAAYRGVVQIMHGCEGAATTRVTVTIPEGVIGAKPMPKPGWQLGTTKGAYAKAYQSFHGKIAEGVTAITWSGGSLGDDEVDEFTFFARITDEFAPGATVYFPVEQECAGGGDKGGIAWTQIPQAGQDAHDLKTPAPGVKIVAAKTIEKLAAKGDAPTAPVKAGDLTIETPWLRATPGGAKVAGGYVSVSNAGAQPDTLIGATIPQAGRGEIHAMSTEGGVMKMAPVEGGLIIAPGGSIALKPGGLHLMFLDLTAGLKAGATVQGALVFERAGTVPVTFGVAPIGAQSPAAQAPGGQGTASAAAEHQH